MIAEIGNCSPFSSTPRCCMSLTRSCESLIKRWRSICCYDFMLVSIFILTLKEC